MAGKTTFTLEIRISGMCAGNKEEGNVDFSKIM